MTYVKLSPGEEALIASIIEHVYPDLKAGSVLPVEPGEHRAALGLERRFTPNPDRPIRDALRDSGFHYLPAAPVAHP